MDFANGTVKKYSREYTRTLKDGKKKKYKTEQVQVTVPKAENIFEDAEEVILIRKDDFNDFEDIEEMNIALEFFNLILTENNQSLSEELNKNKEIIEDIKSQVDDSVSSEVIEELQNELNSKNLTIDDLNSKITLFNDDLLSKNDLVSDLNSEIDLLKEDLNSKDTLIADLNYKMDLLKEDLNNSNINDLSPQKLNDNSLNNDYVKLQKDFIKLSKKFELMQEELFNAKVNGLHYKNLANKYRRFILKLD